MSLTFCYWFTYPSFFFFSLLYVQYFQHTEHEWWTADRERQRREGFSWRRSRKKKLLNIRNVSKRIKKKVERGYKTDVIGLRRQELRWRLRTRVRKSGNSRRRKSLCGRAPVKCALCCHTEVSLLTYDDRTDATGTASSETCPQTRTVSSGFKTVSVK